MPTATPQWSASRCVYTISDSWAIAGLGVTSTQSRCLEYSLVKGVSYTPPATLELLPHHPIPRVLESLPFSSGFYAYSSQPWEVGSFSARSFTLRLLSTTAS
jgi:hypothetical protein